MRFDRLPAVTILIGLLAVVMLVPMVHAIGESDWRSARSFLYAAIFSMFVAGVFSQLLNPMGAALPARRDIFRLILAWTCLPALAAIPVAMITPALGAGGAYFEMVAAMTTTGGTAYGPLMEVPPTIHLWRGLVGWYGGLITLIAAYVIMAPRRLGGFEVSLSSHSELMDGRPVDLHIGAGDVHARLFRALRVILPAYLGATFLIMVLFASLDRPGVAAAVHAMSVMSTSGISPYRGGMGELGNYWIEAVAVVFMIAAATRLLYARASQTGREFNWREDPELRLLLALVLIVTATLFLRHWVGVLTISGGAGEASGFEALWGAFFTAVSYITTTGFESHAWTTARNWSGHDNPALVLLALCAVGGGAATTAGGIKLIRAYALIRHGLRELERIAQPHSVAGAGQQQRGLRREGAFIAWAFMMLFIVSVLILVLALTVSGLSFDRALVAATAAISNTGPAMVMVFDEGGGFDKMNAASRAVLIAGMILGRIETLALIALLNPDSWGRFSIRTKNAGKIATDSPDSYP